MPKHNGVEQPKNTGTNLIFLKLFIKSVCVIQSNY